MTNLDYTERVSIGTDGIIDQLDLWRKQTPVPIDRYEPCSFPSDTFHGWLGEMIKAVADSLELPIDFVSLVGLPALATAVQGKFSLLIEPGYFEPLNIWTIAAMGPSNRKSSCRDAFVEPLQQWERGKAAAMAQEILDAKSEIDTMVGVIKEHRKRASKLDDAEERRIAIEHIKELEASLPEVPTIPSLMFDDATPENVAKLLADNSERISYIESEADALFGLLRGRYSGNDNVDLTLKTYRGESKRVTRQNAAPIDLRHPLISFGLSPQLGLVHEQMKDNTLLRRGFFARFMLAIPKSKLGSRSLTPRPIPAGVQAAYDAQMLRLLSLEANEKDGRIVPHVIKLESGAYRQWKAFQLELEAMMGPDGRMSDEVLTMWAGKHAGNTARLAALLQIGSQSGVAPNESNISADSMQRAIAFMDPLIEHAIAFHDMADHCPELANARTVLQHIKRKSVADEISFRDIQQSLKGRQAFKKSTEIHKAVVVLLERGWLFIKSTTPEVFYLHPEIHPQSPQKRTNGEDGEVSAKPEKPESDWVEGEL